MIFGAWLRERRLALDITTEAMAEALGVTASQLTEIEDGTRAPPNPGLVSFTPAALLIARTDERYSSETIEVRRRMYEAFDADWESRWGKTNKRKGRR